MTTTIDERFVSLPTVDAVQSAPPLEVADVAVPERETRNGRPRRKRRLVRRLARLLVLVVVIVLLLAAGAVLSLRWVEPPTTAFMLRDEYDPIHSWVDGDHVSPHMLLAIIVREDAAFPTRAGGVDYRRTWQRFESYLETGRSDGGSTIQQQLAKNLALWPGKSPVRKVLEIPLAEFIARELPRRRQLELYANLVEFGRGIWGVCAASWYYYRIPPSDLSVHESAALVGLLSMPKQYRAAKVDGIATIPAPPGSRYSSEGLLGYARKHIPPRMRHAGHLLEEAGYTRQPGTRDATEGGARCTTMPTQVRDRLLAEGASATPRAARR